MLTTFIDSWSLFSEVYIAGWLLACLLAVTGVPYVAKDQIFVGAAVTQAAMFGVGVGLWIPYSGIANLLKYVNHDLLIAAIAIFFAVITTCLTASANSYGNTAEALTGWIFLLSMSATIVLLFHTPIGSTEINQRFASSIIGATRIDVLIYGVLSIFVFVAVLKFRNELTLLMVDNEMARAVGLNIRLWELFIAIFTGFILGLSLRTAGMLFTFGQLFLPALIAKNFCKEIRQIFFVAPIVAVVLSVVAFILANHWDYALGSFSIMALCVVLPVSNLLTRIFKRN